MSLGAADVPLNLHIHTYTHTHTKQVNLNLWNNAVLHTVKQSSI